jgi:hypothetical protein
MDGQSVLAIVFGILALWSVWRIVTFNLRREKHETP